MAGPGAKAAAFAASLEAGQRQLAGACPHMRRLIARHGPCALTPQWRRSPYEALVRAVMYQQLHGKAAATILGRFVALFPGPGFPAPEAVCDAPDELLRSAGLSRQKAAYVRAIAGAASEGIVPRRRAVLAALDDEAIVERLTQVHGVGRWTVEMLLIFTLGRLDVLPLNDYGVRAGYARVARRGEVTPAQLLAAGERWRPYRSIASWYLWRATEDKG